MARAGAAMAKSALLSKLAPEPAAPPGPIPRGEERDYTLEELAAFDGSDPSRPILFAVRGKVYDVTRGGSFHGKRGPYRVFAGKDCTRALAKMSFDAADCVGELEGLDDYELEKLEDWIMTFEAKYPVLGALVDAHATVEA